MSALGGGLGPVGDHCPTPGHNGGMKGNQSTRHVLVTGLKNTGHSPKDLSGVLLANPAEIPFLESQDILALSRR